MAVSIIPAGENGPAGFDLNVVCDQCHGAFFVPAASAGEFLDDLLRFAALHESRCRTRRAGVVVPLQRRAV